MVKIRVFNSPLTLDKPEAKKAIMTKRRLNKPVLLICDIQEKFRPAVWGYEEVIATTLKMIKASVVLGIPIYATTQDRKVLGESCSELDLDRSVKTVAHVDKTLFSMCVPEIEAALSSAQHEVVIVGIESHICVTQTTMDLLARGHRVYVLADGVSSCNKEEIPIALKRLANEGAIVTTSEGFLYECMGDACIAEFKPIVKLVKESKAGTKKSLQTLSKI